VSVQPGFVLKKVQVSPVTHLPVMNALVTESTRWTTQSRGIAGEVKVNAPVSGVEVEFFNTPGHRQTQRAGEQGFDLNSHFYVASGGQTSAQWICGQLDSELSINPPSPTTFYFPMQLPHGMTKGPTVAVSFETSFQSWTISCFIG